MPTFGNFDEFEKYLRDNPQVILKENIGEEFEYECPLCKTNAKIKIISENEGRCLKCGNEFNIELTIE